jgi:hypothetical protein
MIIYVFKMFFLKLSELEPKSVKHAAQYQSYCIPVHKFLNSSLNPSLHAALTVTVHSSIAEVSEPLL